MPSFSSEAATVGVAPLCVMIVYNIWYEFRRRLLVIWSSMDSFIMSPSNYLATNHQLLMTDTQAALMSVRVGLLLTAITVGLVFLWRRWREWRRVYNLIEKIPGPPCHPIPFLGHAGIVLELDRAKFKHGTYARK